MELHPTRRGWDYCRRLVDGNAYGGAAAEQYSAPFLLNTPEFLKVSKVSQSSKEFLKNNLERAEELTATERVANKLDLYNQSAETRPSLPTSAGDAGQAW